MNLRGEVGYTSGPMRLSRKLGPRIYRDDQHGISASEPQPQDILRICAKNKQRGVYNLY